MFALQNVCRVPNNPSHVLWGRVQRYNLFHNWGWWWGRGRFSPQQSKGRKLEMRERSSTSVVRADQLVRKSANEWLSSTSEIQCWDLTHYFWLDFLCLELMEAVHKIADIVILKNCKSISKLTFVTTLLPFGFFHWLGTMLWASIWTKRWALLRTQFLLVFLSSVNSF